VEELASDVKEFFDTKGEKAPEAAPAAEATPAETEKPLAPAAETKPAEKQADKTAEKPADEKAPVAEDPHKAERESLKNALSEERARRKEIADQLRREAESRTSLEAKFNAFMKQVEDERKPKPPAYEEDAAGHLKAKTEMSEAELKALRERVESFEKQSAEEKQMQQFRTQVQSATSTFMQDKADYPEAYKHVRTIRKAELMALGVDQHVAEGEVDKWELQLAATAMRLGKNPAEVLYTQAVTLGYKLAETNKPSPETNKPAPGEKIEQLARGQEAARTLGTGSGDQPFSLQKLAEMDEQQIEDFVKSKDWNKLARML
jgi:hypothetical protein